MGCAEILILLSEMPEYNDFFDGIFLMAPPIFMGNSRANSWFAHTLANLFETYRKVYKFLHNDLIKMC